MSAGDSRKAAEETARASYGRLLAILTARTHDISSAEDALANAFESALKHWPERGIPGNPEAWLLTAAKRRLIDEARHHQVREKVLPDLVQLSEETSMTQPDEPPLFPDERLKLLFVCAHPAIARHIHAPLMLQTVLGFDAREIASAFLVPPATMAQRLVRAKTKIRGAAIPFDIPEQHQLAERLDSVLDAIYATYSAGWDDPSEGLQQKGLVSEALWLARLLIGLLPDQPEPKGLLALMLYAEARRTARYVDGAYVPMDEQETALWNRDMIRQAEHLLKEASRVNTTGRYQLEAAIQSAHCHGRLAGSVNWPAIILLYTQLLEIAPSIGALTGRAGAVALSGRTEDALRLLDEIEDKARSYQPWWAVRAHCLAGLGQIPEAEQAYDRAISLSDDKAVRNWLAIRRAALRQE